MTRADLEHLIRAAGTIADVQDLVVIGSQSVLGLFPDAPAELLVSKVADLVPRDHPERSDLIDGTIGEGSPFDRSFGYYAHGVDQTTALLPRGWEERLVLVTGENTTLNSRLVSRCARPCSCEICSWSRSGLRLRCGSHPTRHGVTGQAGRAACGHGA